MPNTDIVDQSNNNATLTPLAGLAGYAHKLSEGHTFYDAYASSRLAAAVQAGLHYVCGYHVLRAGSTSGTDQANFYLDCCARAGFDPSAPGAITMNDWEGWIDGFATAQQARDFADRVNTVVGRETVVHYLGLPNPYSAGFDHIWLADYRTLAPILSPLFPLACVWQWGNQAAGGGDTNQIIDSTWLDHLAGYDDPPDPPGGDMPTILQCTDAWAAFISPSSGSVHTDLSWIDGPTRDAYRGAGVPEQSVTVSQLKFCNLHGPLPTGDMRTWTAGDFRNVLGAQGPVGPPGPAGPKGDTGAAGAPGPSPKGATFTY